MCACACWPFTGLWIGEEVGIQGLLPRQPSASKGAPVCSRGYLFTEMGSRHCNGDSAGPKSSGHFRVMGPSLRVTLRGSGGTMTPLNAPGNSVVSGHILVVHSSSKN